MQDIPISEYFSLFNYKTLQFYFIFDLTLVSIGAIGCFLLTVIALEHISLCYCYLDQIYKGATEVHILAHHKI